MTLMLTSMRNDPWEIVDPRRYPFSEELVHSAVFKAFEFWHTGPDRPPVTPRTILEDRFGWAKSRERHLGFNFVIAKVLSDLGPWVTQLADCSDVSAGSWRINDWMSDKSDHPSTPAATSAIKRITAMVVDERRVFLELAGLIDHLALSANGLPTQEKLSLALDRSSALAVQ